MSTIKSYKAALTTASDALKPTAFATVMAPGNLNSDFDALVKANSTATERRNLRSKQNDLNTLVMQRIAEKVQQDAIKACQAEADKKSAAQKDLLEKASEEVEKEVEELTQDMSSKCDSANKAKIRTARDKFKADLLFLVERYKAINKAKTSIEALQEQIDEVPEAYTEEELKKYDTHKEMQEKVSVYESGQKQAEKRLKREKQAMNNYFQGTEGEVSSDVKREVTALKLPKGIDKEDGARQFGDAVKAFLRNRTEDYGIVTVYVARLLKDLNPSTGERYRPPAISDYTEVPTVLSEKLKVECKNLYEHLKLALKETKQDHILKRILMKTKLGHGANGESIKVEEDDALSAIYAIVKLYFHQDADWQDLVKQRLLNAIPLFMQGSPLVAVEEMTDDLLECSRGGILLPWGSYGEPIVDILSKHDDITHAISDWKLGGDKLSTMSNRQDAVLDLIDMLSVVEQICKHIESKEQNPQKRQTHWKKMANSITIKDPALAARFRSEACGNQGRVKSGAAPVSDGKCNKKGCNEETELNNRGLPQRFCKSCWDEAKGKKAEIVCKDGFRFQTAYNPKLNGKGGRGGKGGKGKEGQKRKYESASSSFSKNQVKKLKKAMHAFQELAGGTERATDPCKKPTVAAMAGEKQEPSASSEMLKLAQQANAIFSSKKRSRNNA